MKYCTTIMTNSKNDTKYEDAKTQSTLDKFQSICLTPLLVHQFEDGRQCCILIGFSQTKRHLPKRTEKDLISI